MRGTSSGSAASSSGVPRLTRAPGAASTRITKPSAPPRTEDCSAPQITPCALVHEGTGTANSSSPSPAASVALASTARRRRLRRRGPNARLLTSITIGISTPEATAQSASTTPTKKYCVAMNSAIARVMKMR